MIIEENFEEKTFIIQIGENRYQTMAFSEDEYLEMQYYSAEDWRNYLRQEQSYWPLSDI